MRLVLASGSPHRAALLQRLGIPFESRAPGIAETMREGESASTRALRLAREKAVAVAGDLADDDALVIGSDQVATLDGAVLHKPGDRARNIAQLQAMRSRRVVFHTGVALISTAQSQERSFVETFEVTVRPVEDAFIERYVDHDRPWDAAGGFHVEGGGIALFSAMHGRDETALVGLPLMSLAVALEEFGVELFRAD